MSALCAINAHLAIGLFTDVTLTPALLTTLLHLLYKWL